MPAEKNFLTLDFSGQCDIIDQSSQSVNDDAIDRKMMPEYDERGGLMAEEKDLQSYTKFLSLDEEKRERIISAAMKEFLKGYKHASTDNIVREAGISKGLLFHYFGTKENLYKFLIEYIAQTFITEFLDVLNVRQPDILDSLWQASLLKHDLSLRYPVIFDFITKAYIDAGAKDAAMLDTIEKMMDMRNNAIAEIYKSADLSLFRDDVDPDMAMNTINWAMNGYAEAKAKEAEALKGTDEPPTEVIRDNYENYLEEFKGYLNFFRKCFYK